MLAVLPARRAAAADDAPTREFNGARARRAVRVPDIALTDTDGAPYSLASDTDKPLTLVFFGYTHCPDICQMVMAHRWPRR